jgi:hypothetical protein
MVGLNVSTKQGFFCWFWLRYESGTFFHYPDDDKATEVYFMKDKWQLREEL